MPSPSFLPNYTRNGSTQQQQLWPPPKAQGVKKAAMATGAGPAGTAVRAGAGMRPGLFLLLILSLLPPSLVTTGSGELGRTHKVTSTYRLTYRIISYLFVSILH